MESLISDTNITWLIVIVSALGALLSIYFYDKRHVVLMEDLRRISIRGANLAQEVDEQKLGISEVKAMIAAGEEEIFVMEQHLDAKRQEYETVAANLKAQMDRTRQETERTEALIKEGEATNERIRQEIEAWKIKLNDVATKHATVEETQKALNRELLDGLTFIADNAAQASPAYQKIFEEYDGDATGMLVAKIELLENQVRYWQDKVSLESCKKADPEETKACSNSFKVVGC